MLVFAPNLGVKPNYPLGQLLHDRFKLPVALGNDVEAATLGELKFGAGQGCGDFVCIFIGTGIGSGIVQNGQLRRGSTGTAGEVGHTVIDADGRLCGCGGRGHLEAYASRTAITRTLLGELKTRTNFRPVRNAGRRYAGREHGQQCRHSLEGDRKGD